MTEPQDDGPTVEEAKELLADHVEVMEEAAADLPHDVKDGDPSED